MIDRKAVDFFAHQSRARDVMVAEREVVLAYALHFLDHKGILAWLAFKGGTALRKLVFGAGGRFSEDLDFTLNAGDTRNREETGIELVVAFDGATHHGVTFGVKEPYVADDSVGMRITYRHGWNDNGEFKLDVSTREVPTLPVNPRAPVAQSYFKHLEFGEPQALPSLQPIEMIAEKLRATFQRSHIRDVYDLYLFATHEATKGFDIELLRGLVVLKLWQVQERRQFTIFEKLRSASYEWDELEHLLPPGKAVERDPMLATIERCFSGLTGFDETDRAVLEDLSHGSGRNEYVAAQLREKVRRRYDLAGR
jgi:predicted nucleotidyltransferase component of viral defense system